MKDSVPDIYEVRARILKALAHPTRLFILDRLTEREYCVCELAGLIGADISTISKHLSMMKNAGVLKFRKEKNIIYYSIACDCVTHYLECVDGVIKSNIDQHKRLLKNVK
jgi:ArsR family transcriptional regulator